MIVGYAIGRSIDARLTVAALKAAIDRRKPPPGVVHHSDRGSQYAAERYRDTLAANGLIGSMGRCGKSLRQRQGRKLHENAEGRGGLSDALRNLEEITEHLPHFIEEVYNKRWLHSALGYLSPQQFEDQHIRQTGKSAA
ncbi:DDE-type integrase/transposase/recombinase (plasmid) [Sinorhizobium numidicum]|uniref:DDE-type integrase/transposase/recombinase n=1 Tax=Sinorhizobium numidicum TaxID=680248 RepID=A0ABY8D372_9HYPH|nr:DDE-type integrase/transposase/recombinase [Sinorhizobium numidicum]WEX79291.1 DDE-type integrase/transposase/recombinase [Sinorhizobium numidicum]WEX85338.1 DDE-type integrase/transposase/recombinase [Sinorhizobium numidicum]